MILPTPQEHHWWPHASNNHRALWRSGLAGAAEESHMTKGQGRCSQGQVTCGQQEDGVAGSGRRDTEAGCRAPCDAVDARGQVPGAHAARGGHLPQPHAAVVRPRQQPLPARIHRHAPHLHSMQKCSDQVMFRPEASDDREGIEEMDFISRKARDGGKECNKSCMSGLHTLA